MSPTLRHLCKLAGAMNVDLDFRFPRFVSRVPLKPYDWKLDWRNW